MAAPEIRAQAIRADAPDVTLAEAGAALDRPGAIRDELFPAEAVGLLQLFAEDIDVAPDGEERGGAAAAHRGLKAVGAGLLEAEPYGRRRTAIFWSSGFR